MDGICLQDIIWVCEGYGKRVLVISNHIQYSINEVSVVFSQTDLHIHNVTFIGYDVIGGKSAGSIQNRKETSMFLCFHVRKLHQNIFSCIFSI